MNKNWSRIFVRMVRRAKSVNFKSSTPLNSHTRQLTSYQPLLKSSLLHLTSESLASRPRYASKHRDVFSATINDSTKMLETTWAGGQVDKFPLVWLRDNCQCPQCFDQVFKSRKTLMSNLDPNIKVDNFQADQLGGVLYITWEDGHVSEYSIPWLKERRFRPEVQELRARYHGRKPILWGAEHREELKILDFNKILTDDQVLYDWITSLEETGLVILTGAPAEQGQVKKIAERVAYLRTTPFGESFQVKNDEIPTNVAYTNLSLGLHTDLSFFNIVAGTSSEGGENVFVDGFQVAAQVRENHPEEFRILTSTNVDFFLIGNDYIDYFLMSRHPIIRLDPLSGEVIQVTFCHHGRDSHMSAVPLEQVEPFYRALVLFNQICFHRNNVVKYKKEEGDICCFHNYRVLHGRSSYSSTATIERHLEGGYIQWDELHSRRRLLKGRLNIPDSDY